MERILLQRWFQVTVGGVVAFVLGMAVWLLALGGPLAAIERPDRAVLHGGSPTLTAPLPLTAPAAAAAGWTDPEGECLHRQGRFLHREGEPYVLIYNTEDSLIGMYLYTEKEMPSPWRFFKNRTAIMGFSQALLKFPDLGYDHWALSVYFKTPSVPCGGVGGHRRP